MEEAERLRVFVNYGPRMSLKTPGTPHFDSCEKQSKDVDNLIGQLDDCLLEAIK